MNFLAHSLLAFGDDDLLVGQFAGDFVRGADLSAHPPDVARGIRLHRHVDVFADRHDNTARLRGLFPKPLRRFAGIAIDVAADYHLVQAWDLHAAILTTDSFEAHVSKVEQVLAEKHAHLPAGLQRFAVVLREEHLLLSWGTQDGVERTLQRLSRRSPGFAPLADCAPVLRDLDATLQAHVSSLWPSLVASTQALHDRMVSAS